MESNILLTALGMAIATIAGGIQDGVRDEVKNACISFLKNLREAFPNKKEPFDSLLRKYQEDPRICPEPLRLQIELLNPPSDSPIVKAASELISLIKEEPRPPIPQVKLLGPTPSKPDTGQLVVGAWPELRPLIYRKEMREISARLTGEETRVTYISGMRGVGKTQLALYSANECQSLGWSVVAWVDAATPESIHAGLNRVVDAAGLSLPGENPLRSMERLFDTWNSNPREHRLIVFDNVENPDDLSYLVPQLGAARVIITTTEEVRGHQTIELREFTPEQAITCIKQITRLDDEMGANQLAKYLGYHPLAIDQACLTLRSWDCTYAEYVQELDKLDLNSVVVRESGESYREPVGKALATSLNSAVSQAKYPSVAQAIIDALSLLGQTGIDTAWFHVLGDPVEVKTSLRHLSKRYIVSLTQRPKDQCHPELGSSPSSDRRYTMHPLLRRVARELANKQNDLQPGRQASAETAAIGVLGSGHQQFLTENYSARRAAYLKMSSQLDAVRSQPESRRLRSYPSVAEWAFETARTANQLEDPTTAERLLKHVEDAIPEEGPPPGGPTTEEVRFELGYAHLISGRGKEAIDHFEPLARGDLSCPHKLRLMSQLMYARAQGECGDLNHAISCLEWLLPEMIRTFGTSALWTRQTRFELARWQGEAGHPEAAVRLLQEVLEVYSSSPQVERMDFLEKREWLKVRHEFAYWSGRKGDTQAAAAEFSKLVAECSVDSDVGEGHPATLKARHELARWTGESGNALEACKQLRALVERMTLLLGPDHPITLNGRHELARWIGKAGNPYSAEAEYADLLRLVASRYPEDHLLSLMTRACRARWRGENHQENEAVAEFNQLLERFRTVLGEEHPHTLTTWHNLAHWKGVSGDLSGAIQDLIGVLAARSTILDKGHPQLLATCHELAYWRAENGEPQAQNELHEVLLARRIILGRNHPDTLESEQALAKLVQRLEE